MELYEQHASYPFEDWLSQRRSHLNWETLLPTDQMLVNCELLSTHAAGFSMLDSFPGENVPAVDDYFLGCEGFPPSLGQELNQIDGYCPVGDPFQAQTATDNSSYSPVDTPSSNFQVQEDNYGISSFVEEDVFCDDFEASIEILRACKMEPVQSLEPVPILAGKKSRAKRLEGQPSKNLMAERRRRKRLNDRLSMLRSIVPKISKMDRTSILGDTIDYMKELLQKIHKLQDEIQLGPNQIKMVQLLKDMKQNEMLVRNSPKFNVERRNEGDTRVEICCTGKPGLLLSTVNTMEALGLDIQQCVISCFNDFALHASCSEKVGEMGMAIASSDDIKQALFRNAGYGGRCS